MMNAYVLLVLSIISEVFGSSMLKSSNGFKKFWPSIGVTVGYGLAFYGISLCLKTIPLGMTYAIWSGLGTALTAVAGIAFFKEKLSGKKLSGFILIICGIALLNFAHPH